MSPRAARRSKPLAGPSRRSGFGKDLLTISAIPRDEIHALLRSAQDLKRTRARGLPHQYLPGLTLGLLFEKPEGAPVVQECLRRGLLINCTMEKVLRFVPPLIVTEAEVDRFLDTLTAVLSKRLSS